RGKFIEAAQAAGLSVESKVHPERGQDGEELAMDVARDGHPNAPAVLLVTSACHGIEGYCGSGVQVAALRDSSWRARARERGLARPASANASSPAAATTRSRSRARKPGGTAAATRP